jgi:glutaredoxin
MGHVIELFTGGCPICDSTQTMVEVGMCSGCTLIRRDLAKEPEAHRDKVEEYGIRMVPTIIVDGRIKVEGKPDFNWLCGDEFYRFLEERYAI